jgi:hypothetical protein
MRQWLSQCRSFSREILSCDEESVDVCKVIVGFEWMKGMGTALLEECTFVACRGI